MFSKGHVRKFTVVPSHQPDTGHWKWLCWTRKTVADFCPLGNSLATFRISQVNGMSLSLLVICDHTWAYANEMVQMEPTVPGKPATWKQDCGFEWGGAAREGSLGWRGGPVKGWGCNRSQRCDDASPGALDAEALVSLPRQWWLIGPPGLWHRRFSFGTLPNFALSVSSFGWSWCVCFMIKWQF